jgi:hypothetical protein
MQGRSDEQADYEWRMEQLLRWQNWTCPKCDEVVPSIMAGVHTMECSMGPLFNPDSYSIKRMEGGDCA